MVNCCITQKLTIEFVHLFQLRLMQSIRESIEQQRFPEFVRNFICSMYPSKEYPQWIVDALAAVNILLDVKKVAAEN